MPTEGEIEAAIRGAQSYIREKFASESRRRWIDQAHDAIVDAILRAAEAHDESRPFEPFARSCIRKAIANLIRTVNAQAGRLGNAELQNEPARVMIANLPADRIATLTPLQRETIRRKYESGESYSAIGRSRGVSKYAVYRIHKRAIIKLKKQIL